MICCSCSIQPPESVESAQHLINDVAGDGLAQQLSGGCCSTACGSASRCMRSHELRMIAIVVS